MLLSYWWAECTLSYIIHILKDNAIAFMNITNFQVFISNLRRSTNRSSYSRICCTLYLAYNLDVTIDTWWKTPRRSLLYNRYSTVMTWMFQLNPILYQLLITSWKALLAFLCSGASSGMSWQAKCWVTRISVVPEAAYVGWSSRFEPCWVNYITPHPMMNVMLHARLRYICFHGIEFSAIVQ